MVDRLLRAGHSVRALARTPPSTLVDGVEPVAVDISSVGSLIDAYRGVDAAVVALPGGADDAVAVAQARAILDALRAASVERAVFNSSGAVWNTPPDLPFLAARTVLAHGLTRSVESATIIAPSTFLMENFSAPWIVAEMHNTGRMAQMFPPHLASVPVSMIDIATATSKILSSSTPPARVLVRGPSPVRGHDVVNAVSAHTGRDISWATVEPSEYLAIVQRNRTDAYAHNLGRLYGLGAHVPRPDPAPAGTVTVTGTTTLEKWVPTQRW